MMILCCKIVYKCFNSIDPRSNRPQVDRDSKLKALQSINDNY